MYTIIIFPIFSWLTNSRYYVLFFSFRIWSLSHHLYFPRSCLRTHKCCGRSRGTKHCKTNLNFMKHFIYILNLFRHSLTKFGQVGSRSHVKCLESDTLELKKGKVKSLIAKSRYFLNHFVSSVKSWIECYRILNIYAAEIPLC